jgi:deazaflavin-dependent oxidoreductase (nitroreductase family)
MDEETLGEQLVGWGKVALLETRGRVSGRPVRTAVGFWQAADGALYVAAGSDTADWVLNLRSDPRAAITIGDKMTDHDALEVQGDERAAALRELILKYGTPAERLGRGPVFRLKPA